MGCEVVSVYNDEVIGKVGFPQAVLDDLIARDYFEAKPLPNPQTLTTKIQLLYGFTQSYTISKLFFTMIKEKQNIVYVAGRFIVIQDTKTKNQRLITNSDFISAFTVSEKLCLVGLIGGSLLLWDLQFLQIKLQILLPEHSKIVSTVGLTSKYIFATDSPIPNNFAYCYDIRTAKLLSCRQIPSLQPAVKSITVENIHVTVCADGIWFIKMLKVEKQLQIVRGMFGSYPKTSMMCAGKVGDYIISGGVDGYAYVWKMSTYKCCRAVKVSDNEITSIGAKGKYIIFGCAGNRVKIYTFDAKKREKKQYIIDVKEDEEEDQIVFILVDSYNKEGQIIAIGVSIADPLLYYCQTKQGLFFQRWLPAPPSQRKRVSNRSDVNQTIQKLNCIGKMIISEQKIYSIYVGGKNLLCVDIYFKKQGEIKLEEERIMIIKQDCQPKMAFTLLSNEIVYVTMANQVVVSATFDKIAEGAMQQSQSEMGQSKKVIVEMGNQQILQIDYLQKGNEFLCITTNISIWVYQRTAKLTYQQRCHVKYQSAIPSLISIGSQELIYDEISQEWKFNEDKFTTLSQQTITQHSIIHTAKIKSLHKQWADAKISCGGGFCILWK